MDEKRNEAILTVENLKKYYPVKGGMITHTVAQVRAVDDVSFSVRQGETLGLVGESGCGKSTVGRQIVALEKPTAGRVLFDGAVLSELSERKLGTIRTQLQMVFQDSYSSLNPRKRVFDILAEPMRYHHIVKGGETDAEVSRLLALVGLPQSAGQRFPHEFSGGQRQRICIARALSLRPRLIVCDEPVSALDVSIQAQILNLLRELQKELGLTCLFIGHGLGAVNYVSDRIAVMYLGKIVELADANTLFTHPAHPYTRALCAAVPNPDPNDRNEALVLQGEVGTPTVPQGADAGGCRFYSRCQMARPACRETEPSLAPIAPGSDHLAACPFTEVASPFGDATSKQSAPEGHGEG
jgi:oligopeptide/dipeptide ABC transporter ATP-binding protein